MNETYTRKQAMERLGISSTNAFLFLAKEYPEPFVIVNQGTAGVQHPRYDKATIDQFAERRKYLKQIVSREQI